MRKVLDFRTYKNLRNMSFNDMNRWATSVYLSGFQDGQEDIKEGAVIMDEDQLLQALTSVKGIGQKRAAEAVRRITGD